MKNLFLNVPTSYFYPTLYNVCSLGGCKLITSITMSSPLRAHHLRPSPLTNSKLLDKFKGVRPIAIKIEDVHELGDMYKKKETSIR